MPVVKDAFLTDSGTQVYTCKERERMGCHLLKLLFSCCRRSTNVIRENVLPVVKVSNDAFFTFPQECKCTTARGGRERENQNVLPVVKTAFLMFPQEYKCKERERQRETEQLLKLPFSCSHKCNKYYNRDRERT